MQWFLQYLIDYDIVILLKKCAKNLSSDGYIIIKENYWNDNNDKIDKK